MGGSFNSRCQRERCLCRASLRTRGPPDGRGRCTFAGASVEFLKDPKETSSNQQGAVLPHARCGIRLKTQQEENLLKVWRHRDPAAS
jgi:hypothetical protein